MSVKKFEWKPLLYAVGVLAALFLLVAAYINNQTEFKVVHFDEVQSVAGSDGRAAAGSPEVYQVQISPALAWELSAHYAGVWRGIAWIVLILVEAFIGLQARDTFDLGKSGSTYIAFAGLVIAFSCYLAAFTSAFVSNYKEIDKATYERVKDDHAAKKALFTETPLIR